MNKMPIVYLAGPIAGTTYEESTGWRDQVADRLRYCDVRSPMRGKQFLAKLEGVIPEGNEAVQSHELAKEAVDAAVSSPQAIVRRDHWDVHEADILVVNLYGAKSPSIGTMFELAWAYHTHKPAVVIMEKEGNPNDHPFVRLAAYIVVQTTDQAVAIVRQLLNQVVV